MTQQEKHEFIAERLFGKIKGVDFGEAVVNAVVEYLQAVGE